MIDLTGSAPEPRTIDAPVPSISHGPPPPLETTAGLSHELTLNTRYYRAQVPIWLDETPAASGWRTDFLSPDARDVVKAVGAWIVVFRKTAAQWTRARELMEAVVSAIEIGYGGEGIWSGTLLCVGMPAKRGEDEMPKIEEAAGSGYEEFEDVCDDLGFEFVDGGIKGQEGKVRDAAGELRGTARLMEALESNEWDNVDDLEEEGLDFLEDVRGEGVHAGPEKDETLGFKRERSQMEKEFADLQLTLAGAEEEEGVEEDGEEDQAEALERMMLKMTAAREMSAHLPEQEKKRMARRTVNEIMKEL